MEFRLTLDCFSLAKSRMERIFSPALSLPLLSRHHLCRARHYCHEVDNCAEALHAQVERLVQQAGHQADSSVALYYFNASLYLLRVLKGNTKRHFHESQKQPRANTGPESKGPQVSRACQRTTGEAPGLAQKAGARLGISQ
jgi:hypothetical protein